MSNDQLKKWTGQFGDDYTDRNIPDETNAFNRTQFWFGILSSLIMCPHPTKILEVGANVGANLSAIDSIYKSANTNVELMYNEPNEKASGILKQQWPLKTPTEIKGALPSLDCPSNVADLTFTCGVLIHVHPDNLIESMREIYRTTSRYIICSEYFSATPREILYRGNERMLWTRDFGSYWMDNFPGMRLVNYSFAWKRVTGMDNLTTWVFQKVH